MDFALAQCNVEISCSVWFIKDPVACLSAVQYAGLWGCHQDSLDSADHSAGCRLRQYAGSRSHIRWTPPTEGQTSPPSSYFLHFCLSSSSPSLDPITLAYIYRIPNNNIWAFSNLKMAQNIVEIMSTILYMNWKMTYS